MKTFYIIGLIFNVAAFVYMIPMGCSQHTEPMLLRSVGSPGDLLVVTDVPPQYKNAVQVDEWFGDEFPALPQSEKWFRTSQINVQMFEGHWRQARNVVFLRYNAESAQAQVAYSQNRWAASQQIAEITFADTVSLTKLLHQELPRLKQRFYNADLLSMTTANKKAVNEMLMQQIEKAHGIKITIPQGYRVKKDTVGFTWLEFSTPQSTIGLLFYSGEAKPDADGGSLTDWPVWRDTNLGVHVIGERDGSCMVTENEQPLWENRIDLGGRMWNERRGLWKMRGDFMGGPFVSLVNTNGNKTTVVEGFVYAPGYKHKSFLVRSVDSVLRTVRL